MISDGNILRDYRRFRRKRYSTSGPSTTRDEVHSLGELTLGGNPRCRGLVSGRLPVQVGLVERIYSRDILVEIVPTAYLTELVYATYYQ